MTTRAKFKTHDAFIHVLADIVVRIEAFKAAHRFADNSMMKCVLPIFMIAYLSLISAGASHPERLVERMITQASQPHVLTSVNVWSPDGNWIVYDVRSAGNFDGSRIERVNVETGEVQRLYESQNGAHCGVVTYSPVENKIVFILGPEFPTEDWSYGFTRRRGVLVDAGQPGAARPLDAMNYAPPFQPGALRGGSHVHVFSPDGRFVSFTYEDEVLAQLDADPSAPPHDPNQRNIGVAVPAGPVEVARTHPRNHDGEWFSVVVTKTEAEALPGSDQISRAFEEAWIGKNGYLRSDGGRQHKALAFQGVVTAVDGSRHAEVFVVDLPADLTREGDAPLAGTATTRPAPPVGVHQRRISYTDDRRFPGIAATPRHWLCSSPDGEAIAFLMRDDAGVVQLWTVSPRGGEPRMVTRNAHDIASAFTWSPSGSHIAHIMDGSVCETEVATGSTHRLTVRNATKRAPSVLACVYSPSGDEIAYLREIDGVAQIFVVASSGALENFPRTQYKNAPPDIVRYPPPPAPQEMSRPWMLEDEFRHCLKSHSQIKFMYTVYLPSENNKKFSNHIPIVASEIR